MRLVYIACFLMFCDSLTSLISSCIAADIHTQRECLAESWILDPDGTPGQRYKVKRKPENKWQKRVDNLNQRLGLDEWLGKGNGP
jgi:hypothetical protein